MSVEFAIHNGERVLVVLKEKWRVLVDRPDGTRQWVEPHTLKPVEEQGSINNSKSTPLPSD